MIVSVMSVLLYFLNMKETHTATRHSLLWRLITVGCSVSVRRHVLVSQCWWNFVFTILI